MKLRSFIFVLSTAISIAIADRYRDDRYTSDGSTYDGYTYGKSYDGNTYGKSYDGNTYGKSYDGNTYDGNTYDGNTYDGNTKTYEANRVNQEDNFKGIPWMAGLNFAGFEFGIASDGKAYKTSLKKGQLPYRVFDIGQITHFVEVQPHMNLVRIPIGWNHLEPTIGAEFDANYVGQLKSAIDAALGHNMTVIISMFSYGRRDGKVINVDGPSPFVYGDTWGKLVKLLNNTNLIYDVVSGAQNVDPYLYARTVQVATDKIRLAGAIENLIIISTDNHANLLGFPERAEMLLDVTDKSYPNDNRRLIFAGRLFMDKAGDGSSKKCESSHLDLINNYVNWLRHHNRYGLITQIGSDSTDTCQDNLRRALNAIGQSYPTIVGFAAWAAGAYPTTADDSIRGFYMSLAPNKDGSDQPVFTNVIMPAISRPCKSTSNCQL